MANKVIKNFSLLTVSNFINQFILVFSGIKIARTLGPASYGLYTYLFAEKNIYAAISDLGLRNIIIRTIARYSNKAKETFFSSISLQIIGLLLGVAVMLVYEHYTHSVMPSLIVYVILAVFLNNLWATCESVWQGQQRMGVPAIINVVWSVVWIAYVLLTPASTFTVSLLFRYYCYIQILQVGNLLLFTFFTDGILTGEITGILNSGVKIMKESSAYYLNNLMVLPTSSLSNNFLERNTTKKELGYFNTSNRLISPINLIITLGLSAIFPNLSALWTKNKESLLTRVSVGFPIFAIGFGLVCFSFALVSKELITFLFGIKYLPAVPIIQFQIWFVFIFGLNCFIGTVWGATDNQRLLIRSSIINTLIATPLLYIGSKYGGLGLAYSYLIGYALFFPILFYLFVKSLNLSIKIIKEAFLVGLMFTVTSFLPLNTNVFIRLAIIIIALLLFWKFYFEKVKQHLIANKNIEI